MIRVLNIISDTNIGGAGRVLLNYLQYADRTRFETMVALPKDSLLIPELRRQKVRIFQVTGLADRSYHRDDVKVLTALIRRLKPDIVHTHGALSGRIAGRRCGAKVVYTRHSAFPVPAKLRYPPGRWINGLFNARYADHIIAVSPAAAQNLTDSGISPKRITTLMNGVAPVPRCTPEQCAAARQQWDLEEDVFTMGILARIEPYKGHMDILQAARILADQGRPFQLLIAGAGGFEEEVRREASRLGLSGRVHFLGFLSDVARFLSLLDVQLNASWATETSSLSILEGFSMGLPAIVSDYGGNPCLVEEGENGLIFPVHDSSRLAAHLARLMDEPHTLAAMGKRAREIYGERFTGEIFAANVEAVYDRVLKRTGPST